MSKISPSKIEKNPHMMSLKELQEKYQVDISKGLSVTNAKEKLAKIQSDKIEFSYFKLIKIIIANNFSFISFLFTLTFIIYIVLYQPLGGNAPDPTIFINVGILLLMFIVKTISIYIQEYKAFEKAKLPSSNKDLVSVLRDSTWIKIQACDLVIGDVVEIKFGQRIPVDIRLFYVSNLQLDKSILTGNNEPVEAMDNNFESIQSNVSYMEARNMAFANFFVLNGYGRGIVVSIANINPKVEPIKRAKYLKNPIHQGFEKLTYLLFFLSLLFTIIYVIVWAVWMRISFNFPLTLVLGNAFNIFVSGIPIGIPIAVFLSLLITDHKLRKSNVAVKYLATIPAVSNIDVVITGKLGMLTQDNTEVVNIMYGTQEIEANSISENSLAFLATQSAFKEFLEISDFCTKESQLFLKSEICIFNFARKYMPKKLCEEYEVVSEFSHLFSYQSRLIRPQIRSSNKIMTIDSSYILMYRGAPDVLLPKCKYMLNDDLTCIQVDKEIRRQIENKARDWAFQGKRVIIFCKKKFNNDYKKNVLNSNLQKWFDSESNDLIFIGLVGFTDPLYPGVKESIEKIRKMGVRVVMVTRDFLVSAAAIASEVGIFSDIKYDTFNEFMERNKNPNAVSRNRAILLNGSEIDTLSKEDWTIVFKNYAEIVLSRTAPSHKSNFIKEIQANGHSVLFTGAEMNDLAAIKQADIAVALHSGDQIYSSASSIVLLNNSMGSIYELLVASRQAFANTRKIIIFSLISSVFSQYLSIFLTSLIGLPQLYTNLQMIIVSAFTDIFLSITLFFQKLEPADLRVSKEKLINSRTLVMGLLFLGPLTTLLSYLNFFLYFKLYAGLNPSQLIWNFTNTAALDPTNSAFLAAQTIGFYSMVVIQVVGNLFSIRTQHLSLFQSLPFMRSYRNFAMIAVSIIICIVATLMTWFSIPGVTNSIPPIFYAFAWACSLFVLLINEFLKLILNFFMSKQ